MSRSCDQCQAAVINGVFCHEAGCPNHGKTWDPLREQWVLYVPCPECGFGIEVGEQCDCMQPLDLDAWEVADAE